LESSAIRTFQTIIFLTKIPLLYLAERVLLESNCSPGREAEWKFSWRGWASRPKIVTGQRKTVTSPARRPFSSKPLKTNCISSYTDGVSKASSERLGLKGCHINENHLALAY
jgi:hypothetical protein